MVQGGLTRIKLDHRILLEGKPEPKERLLSEPRRLVRPWTESVAQLWEVTVFTIINDEKISKSVRLFEKLQLTKKAMMMYFCMRDPKTPVRIRVAIAGALAHFFNPLNWMIGVLSPDGYLYHDMVILLVFAMVEKHIEDEHRRLADKWLKSIPEHGPIFCIGHLGD